jgi:hypothetical protein
MRFSYRSLLPLALLVIAPAVRAQQSAAASPIDRLAWMAGCWERRNGTRVVEEQWMRPRGGTMLGMSRTVRNDSLVEFEQLRIRTDGNVLVYIAKPSGQAESSFRSTVVDANAVTFEDPTHDFPQRIIYRLPKADSLHARIEGMRGGQLRGVDFPMRRVSCL